MDLQQINVKVFTTEESEINYTNFIKVFNRWMEEADSDDYLNYADYSHVDCRTRRTTDFEASQL